MEFKVKRNNELYHHGVKGMRWGVWNDETTARYAGGVKRNTTKNNVAKSSQSNEPKEKKKSIKKMTDEELKKKVDRMMLEKQYIDLQNQTNPGKKYVTDILKDVGKKVIVTAAAGAILYALQSEISGEFDANALAKAVFNGGAKKK